MFLDIDSNIGNVGGVGEAYPGSDGGEIFNCYENSTFGTLGTIARNAAIGAYSTVKGASNAIARPFSFVCGFNNYDATTIPSGWANGMMLCGRGNHISSTSGFTTSSFGIMMGENNMGYATNAILIGYNNANANIAATNKILIGQNIQVRGNQFHGIVHLGQYNNNDTFNTNDCILTIGAGKSGNYKNALEVYGPYIPDGANKPLVYIPHNFALQNYTAANKARVNAITEPLDPNNLTNDDQTLVTKSYISSEVGHSKTYWPASEQSLSANTSYSIGTLVGDNSWTFPYSSGSIVFALYVGGVEYRATLILPPYLDPNVTPKLKVPITACYNYNNGDNGRIDGVLLVYDTSTKEISFENPEGIEFDNPGDTLTSAYNYGNIDIWFVGLTCFDHI